MNRIFTIDEYPIGWGWLQQVPLKDWEWLLEVFATMTDNMDTYNYAVYDPIEFAPAGTPETLVGIKQVELAKFLCEDQGYLAGIREYGHYIAAKTLGIKSERDYMDHYDDIRSICNEIIIPQPRSSNNFLISKLEKEFDTIISKVSNLIEVNQVELSKLELSSLELVFKCKNEEENTLCRKLDMESDNEGNEYFLTLEDIN